MNNYIFQKQVLIDLLCEDIIELFDESNNNHNEMNIPKYSNKWEKIELFLYKELLIYINKYKNNIVINNSNQDKFKNLLIENLNKELYTRQFKIRKYSNDASESIYIKPPNNNPNRYNFLNFIFILNDNNCEITINNYKIISKCGDLLLFPSDFSYKIEIPLLKNQYIICGEIAYNEIDK